MYQAHDKENLFRLLRLDSTKSELPKSLYLYYERVRSLWAAVNNSPMSVEALMQAIVLGNADAKEEPTNGQVEKPILPGEQPLDPVETVATDWKRIECPGTVQVTAFYDGQMKQGTYMGSGTQGKLRVSFQGDEKKFRHILEKDVQLA